MLLRRMNHTTMNETTERGRLHLIKLFTLNITTDYHSNECLHSMPFIWLLWLTVSLCLGHVASSPTQGRPSYICPRSCQCVWIDDNFNSVNLVCYVPYINNFSDFTVIQSNYTTWLTVICTAEGFHSAIDAGAFSHLRHLTELSLISCKFDYLQRQFLAGLESLKLLKIINSPHRHAMEISSDFFTNTPQIEQVLFSADNILTFPSGALCNLSQLKVLNVSYNLLSKLNGLGVDIEVMRNIQNPAYNMDEKSTQHKPESKLRGICLEKLTVLDAQFNLISSLDGVLSTIMPYVQTVNFAHNQIIKVLPSFFHNLSHLTSIDLSHNRIKTLSPDLLLNSNHIKQVYLNDNKLTYVHYAMLNHHDNLQILTLQNNSINSTTLIDGLLRNKSRLVTLDISNNKLILLTHVMFTDLTNLSTLMLHDNSIREFTNGSFRSLHKLQKLSLHNNNCGKPKIISSGAFLGLKSLQVLNLANNAIVSIDDEAFLSSPIITNLNLTSNRLQSMPCALRSLSHLQILDLTENNISVITRESFTGLTSLLGVSLKGNRIQNLLHNQFIQSPNLRIINLGNNNISFVEYQAFKGLRWLYHLKLDHNHIEDLFTALSSLDSLLHLDLSYNNLKILRNFHLPRGLQHIYLSHNQLTSLGLDTIYNLHNLISLDLSYNKLDKFSPSSLNIDSNKQVKPNVRLRGNLITCSCHMKWLKHVNNPSSNRAHVEDLYFVFCKTSRSQIKFIVEVPDDDYSCWYDHGCDQLQCLQQCCNHDDYLTSCPCSYFCPPSCLCYHDTSKSKQTVDCSGGHLRSVPPSIPHFVTHLYLNDNNITSLNKSSFTNLNNIQQLNLSHNHISVIESGSFQPLTKLINISMDHNGLTHLHSGFIDGLRNVKHVYLHNNTLTSIDNDTFIELSHLQYLALNNNQLRYIYQHIFDYNYVLNSLYLSGNPWQCNCDNGPNLQKWIIQQSRRISDAGQITCDPGSLETDTIYYKQTNQTEYSTSTATIAPSGEPLVHQIDFSFCTGNNTITAYVTRQVENKVITATTVSFAVICIVTVSLILIIFRYRRYIQIYLFARYGWRFHKPIEDKTKHYDAFISFSSEDDHFVMNELTDVLEGENYDYKLCIHYRDFLEGADIAEAIVEAVEWSKRTIIVLSNNFLESEWCSYEFKTAHRNLLQDKTNRVIIVLLSELDQNKVDKELRLYMKTNTYIKWGDPWFWHKLNYAMPQTGKAESHVDINTIPLQDRPLNLLLPFDMRRIPGEDNDKNKV